MLVSSLGGELKAQYICHNVALKIIDRDFWTDPVVIDSHGIDIILGMGWLSKAKANIQCHKNAILLTSPKGEEIEFVSTPMLVSKGAINELKGISMTDIRVVGEYPDVFPEKLPRMPPDRDIEFIIDLLPGTAPISKRPYRSHN